MSILIHQCRSGYIIISGNKSMLVYKINDDMIMIKNFCTNTTYEVHIDSLYGIPWLTPIIDSIHSSTQLSSTYFDDQSV